MDNKLILERDRLIKEKRKNESVIKELTTFLNEYESCFTNEESVQSLKKIREYLIKAKEMKKQIITEEDSNIKNIQNNCKHEVLTKSGYYSSYLYCSICDETLNEQESLKFKHYLVEIDSSNQEMLIYNIILDIARNNENIFDVFENKLIEKTNNIRVYRRN